MESLSCGVGGVPGEAGAVGAESPASDLAGCGGRLRREGRKLRRQRHPLLNR